MNKRLHILLVFAWCLLAASAQNINVASFKLLPNDLTANTHGTMERDQNGEVAALIKVVTSEQGFTFDGGMVGITKVKQEVGEIWVYVPHGLKKITIKHQQLGVLRDYFFDLPIEKARTYELVLTTGRVETVVTHAVTKQFVVFNVTPADAVVELADEVLSVDGDGVAQQLVPYGSYNYRVSRPNYHTEAGIIEVTAEGKAEKHVTLRPNYGWIKVGGSSDYDGAYVYIDNERVGQFPYTSKELKSGTHRVKVVKSMYKTYEQQVTVKDNETTELNVQLVANFANVTLTAGEACEIWVDGQHKGNEQWSGPLQIGNYTVEVRKPSHRNTSEIVTISTSEERSIQLKRPTPIYATLVVSSTPARATVYIDGVEAGTTPLLKNDLLIGSHQIEFRKEGYASVTETIEVKEGEENQLSAELTNQQKVSIGSNPSGASVTIDGVYKGVTPLLTTLSYGEHTFEFAKNDYRTESRKVNVDHQTTTISQTLSVKSQQVAITSSPSGASVMVNGTYKGTTPLSTELQPSNYTVSLTKKGYDAYSGSLKVPSGSNQFYYRLNKTYRPPTNTHYKWLSIYIDGYGLGALASHRYALDYGVGGGIYFGGFNVELDFGMRNLDSEYLSSMGFRIGWGIECGNRLIITPQIGIRTIEFSPMRLDDYYYTHGYYENNTYYPFTLGCRVQYSLNRFFALFVTPEYGYDLEANSSSTFQARAGITINLGGDKDSFGSAAKGLGKVLLGVTGIGLLLLGY